MIGRHGPIRIRWWIFAFMSAFAMLAYIQRTSLSVAAEKIMPALHLTQMQIGWLNAAFTTAYALSQLPGGILSQRIGARTTFTVIGIVGLIATIATPIAPALLTGTALFVALLAAQALLGAAQGPVFPAWASIAEAWFPQRQWATVNGLVAAFMNIGGAVTPLLIVLLTLQVGWQGALLCIALPTALLTIGWAWYGRNTPREHAAVTAEELAELPPTDPSTSASMTVHRLLHVLGDRNVLLLALSYLCMNYAFYLLSFWSFLYLVEERHFAGIESGLVGMLPWVGAGLGAGVGGYLSDALAIRFGFRWGYRLAPVITLPAAGVLLLVTVGVSTPYAAVLGLVAAFFAVEITEGAYWAATMRVARADTAAATGALNTGGNMGGIIAQPVVAALSGSGHWNAAFFTGTGFAMIAALCWLFVDADRQTPSPGEPVPR
jgi:ACS family glucarate transporter-like MFS transporter